MSYHHTCPGCAVDQARRRHDEPDRGTLCEGCSSSLVYALGRLAAIRAEVKHGAAWLEHQADRVPRCMGADRAEASLRSKAADCRRWLEATRY